MSETPFRILVLGGTPESGRLLNPRSEAGEGIAQVGGFDPGNGLCIGGVHRLAAPRLAGEAGACLNKPQFGNGAVAKKRVDGVHDAVC